MGLTKKSAKYGVISFLQFNRGVGPLDCLTSKYKKMKKIKLFALLFSLVWLSSCYEEDPGPRQQDDRNFAIVDFDRIEASDALIVSIKYSENFSIEASGDRRNLDDLLVTKNGNTLIIKFNHYQKRQYTTTVNITLPVLYGVDFSGAVNAQLSGFAPINRMDVSLSGASLTQLSLDASEIHFSLSGASQLRLNGEGQLLEGNISGASILTAFEYLTNKAELNISGASNAKVSVGSQLNGIVSGASVVLYRGNPEVNIETSGSSTVQKD